MENLIIATNKSVLSGTYEVIKNRKVLDMKIADKNISGCSYNNNNFENTVFINCNFQGTEITKTSFINCTFVNCNFSFIKFKSCSFIACKIENCLFSITNSLSCNFQSCMYDNTHFEESDSFKQGLDSNEQILLNSSDEMTSITLLSSLSLDLGIAA